jgi:allantoicase
MSSPTDGLQAFADMLDLASAEVGGRALWCSDDWFASVHNLVKADPAVFDPDAYCDTGKVMDGWESRRRRTPGHDTAIIALGVPGVVYGVDIDTSWFMGNHPPFGAVDGAFVEGDPTPEQLRDEVEWVPLTGQVPLQRGSHNLFAVRSPRPITHVRLHMLPDGGVARLRVFGHVRRSASDERLDLAAAVNGGRPVGCSDMFFSPMTNLIAPGLPAHMGKGWETRRRRDDGADWIVTELGVPGRIDEVVLHTMHFKGNYPDRASLYGLWWPDAPHASLLRYGTPYWRPIVEWHKLRAHAEHRIAVDAGPFTHVKLVIHPCGGVARMRLLGTPEQARVEEGGAAALNRLDSVDRRDVLLRCCGSSRWASRMAAHGPFGSDAELHGLADHLWWDLADGDWLEAFTHHPRIGADVDALRAKFARTAEWSEGEQAGVGGADEATLQALAEGNRAYEERFGFLFIVCATGKTAAQMLALLRERLGNEPEAELRIAAGEQAKITHLRLEKL